LHVILTSPPQPQQVWNFHYGKDQSVYIWKPVPPSADFVTLGMVATTSEEPPPLEDIHCVVRGREMK
jgi:hypothetical protein